jgi:type IV secretory pathway TraG/TraD family ATPase VirD4
LPAIHKERLWFFLDELPTLQKLDILKLALTNTRKYGLCCVIGVQDFSQLYEIYGHDLAKTIISGCQTKLLLRVTDGAAAKLLAELMGQVEIDEKEETLSYGVESARDGVSINSRRALRDIVLTSEVLTLPDMTGYLLTPGNYPIARVEYSYTPTQKISEGFVERQGFSINYQAQSSSTTFTNCSQPTTVSLTKGSTPNTVSHSAIGQTPSIPPLSTSVSASNSLADAL